MPSWESELSESGFAVIPNVLPEALRGPLMALFAEHGGKAGRRLATEHEPVRALACSGPVRLIVELALGPQAFLVRATLFDKTPGANWLVTLHQDITLAVRERREVPGFSGWSVKHGVPHAQAPAKTLEDMVALRVHLDPCTVDSGPLLAIAGSHRRGILETQQIQELKEQAKPEPGLVDDGGALLMRPLLVHASSKASSPDHRRVVHLEFAQHELPGGLEWYARCPMRS